MPIPSLYALGAAAFAACGMRTSTADLDTALAAAEKAYAELDTAEFARASIEVDFVVPCLAEAATPALAARLHRMRGLGSFADSDSDAALAAFRAARRLEPGYVFPEALLPPGFEVREIYEGLPTDPGPSERLPRPRRGEILIDGSDDRQRPTDRMVLFQHLDGGPPTTRYLAPSDPVPWYPGVRKRQTAWIGVAAGTAAAAATCYGLSWASRGALERADASWTDPQLVEVQTRTNALFFASIALGVATGAELVVAARVE